jgi:hypothetical protein
VLFSTLPRLVASLAENFDFACFRLTLFLTIVFVNATETTYLRGDHHLWFLMQLVLWQIPSLHPAEIHVEPQGGGGALAAPARPQPRPCESPRPAWL